MHNNFKFKEIQEYKNFIISKLHENDPNFKFVPFGYKIEEMDTEDIGNNQYLIARYGEEGANKMERVISKNSLGLPFSLASFGYVDKEKITLSAISSWSLPMVGLKLTIRANLNPKKKHLYKIYYTKIIE